MNALETKATLSLGGIFALRMLGLFMIIPVFSIYGDQYAGATPVLIGLAVGIYGLSQAILQIPVSMLGDRFARKPIILVGLLLFALGGALAATAESIWQVIIGRALAGSGAISAVVMALLADVTREQSRSKAMAVMGFLIALSILLALTLGPILSDVLGMSGLFWLTSLAGILGIFLLLITPTPSRMVTYNLAKKPPLQQLKQVFQLANVKQLYLAVFSLHLLITMLFVLVPIQLTKVLGLTVAQHSLVYLPLLILSFIVSVPFIMLAEKKRQMRKVVILAIVFLLSAYIVLAIMGHFVIGLWLGLGVFFIGFNLLEATIPSWLAKQAPVTDKSTVMGFSASSQFLGAFAGGTLGGYLLQLPILHAWVVCVVLMCVVLLVVLSLSEPPYLTSLTTSIPDNMAEQKNWVKTLNDIVGVEDVVILAKEKIAYLKIDKQKFNQHTRQQLSHIINQPLDF